jgi:hypothetical protein
MPLGWTDIVPDILEQAEIKVTGVAGQLHVLTGS